MSTATYTPDELKTLASAVMISGMAISMVDVGIVSTAIEATALGQEVASAAKKYPTNSIIQSLFSEEAVKQGKEAGTLKIEVKPEEMKPEVAVDTAIAKVNAAMEILNGKATPEEIQQFKEFIYNSAEHVANAAGSGIFGTGSKVSATEAAALTKLKAALGL
jgi:hypothetical protein